MPCSINVCALLEIFRSQVVVHINKDDLTNRYGMAIFRKVDMAYICGWEPFTKDLETLKNHLRGVFELAMQYGSIAYFQKGSFLFDRYNLESEILNDDSDVLTKEKIEQICINLKEKEIFSEQESHASYLGAQW